MSKLWMLALIILISMLAGCGGEEREGPDTDLVRLSDKDAAIAKGLDINGFHDRFSEYKWVVRLDKNWDEIYYSDSEPKIELSSGTGGSLICLDDVVIFQNTFNADDSLNVLFPYGYCKGTGKHSYRIYRQK